MAHSRFGWYVVLISALIPLLVWIFMQPFSTRIGSFSVDMRSLGQVSALVGMVLFALSFLLNTRARFVENSFGGLDKMYSAHHIIGSAAFILLLFHPLFLASRFLSVSIKSAALFLLPGKDIAINAGIFSLLLMIFFIVFTFFITMKYNLWKSVHKLFGLAFLIGAVHVLLISSDTSNSILLKGYMILFIIIGFCSYTYKTVFSKLFIKKFQYIVSSISDNGGIFELTLSPVKDGIKCSSGQFVFINFKEKGFSKEQHPFSIASCKNGEINLGIKSLGDYTSTLGEIKKGAQVEVEGPYGGFIFNKSQNPQIWIAGGIGITPFLSRLREGFNEEVCLYYSVKNGSEAVFLSELKEFEKKFKNFKLFVIYTDKQGRLTAEKIESSGFNGKDFFICGPSKMISDLKRQLIKRKVPKKNIYDEGFNLR